MSTPLVVQPVAETDIQAAHRYLEEVRPGLGDMFSIRLREVFERIEANPLSCGTIWRDVRAVRLRKFQYVIYYVSFDDHVDILAVLHGARDDAAWRSRMDS